MKNFTNMLWLIFSLFMVVVGFAGCLTPLQVFMSFIIFLPFLLILGAVVGFWYYLQIKEFEGANFILLDSLVNVLFAVIFLVGGVEFTSLSVVMIVAFMSMFKGILGFMYMCELKKRAEKYFWLGVFSLLNIIIALVFITYPSIGGLTIGFMISLLVLFFGLANALAWFGFKKTFH